MTNTPQPDRANAGDFDELADIPTYNPNTEQLPEQKAEPGLGKFYDRYNRSAPQSVAPNPDNSLYKVSSEPEPTAVFPSTPEPEYVAPAPATPVSPAPASLSEPLPEAPVEREVVADGRRGTIDLGLMIIRVVVGLLLIHMSLRTFFELGGADGINALKTAYADYAFGNLLAVGVPTLQLIAGVFLLLGLLTPVAAAVATTVTGFGALHAIAQADGLNLMNPQDSLTLPMLLLALALGLQFTGPGKISLDVARTWAKRPLASSWIWAVIGIAGAACLWWFGAGINPLG